MSDNEQTTVAVFEFKSSKLPVATVLKQQNRNLLNEVYSNLVLWVVVLSEDNGSTEP